MAIPTITNVSPTTGPARGYNVMTITGTNFRTRPAAYSAPYTDLPNTVEVTVGGLTPFFTRVVSDTDVRVVIPEYKGSASVGTLVAVDVVATNLDDTGVAIPTETVTSSGAYTYRRPQLRLPRGDPPALQVLNALIQTLMRQLVTRVGWVTHTDYGDAGDLVTVVTEHPSIALRITLSRDTEYGHVHDNVHVVHNGQRYRPAKTYMLTADLTLSAQDPAEAMHLVSEVEETWRTHQELEVPGDPNWDASVADRYPLEMVGDTVQASSSNRSNVTAFACQWRVRGIPIFSDYPVQQIYTVSNLYIAYTHLGASTFHTTTLP